MAHSTEPDELLPACVEARPSTAQALHETRADGARYQSFIRKLSEEVVLQSSDDRLEPASERQRARR